jgi:hypothetical protein
VENYEKFQEEENFLYFFSDLFFFFYFFVGRKKFFLLLSLRVNPGTANAQHTARHTRKPQTDHVREGDSHVT